MSGLDPRLVDVGGLAVVALALVGMRRAPRFAFGCWLAVLCLVPVWVGVQLKVYVQPQVVIGLVALAALFPLRRRLPVRLTAPDLLVLAFVGTALVPALLGDSTLPAVFDLLTQWSGAYALGRLLLHRVPARWVYGAIAVAFAGVAVLTLLEAAAGWNPFLHLPGSAPLRAVWATVQLRGGRPRAEGAFGHSIALGGSLAMAIPFALAAPFRPAVRLGLTVLLMAAVVPTFSRIGLGTAVLGVLLTVLAGRTGMTRRLRVGVAAALAAVTLVALPLVDRVFAAAGDEAAGSAAYRADLLGLVKDMAPLGLSGSYYRSPTGTVSFGSFRSIDSALVLLGLTYGAVPLACVLVALAVAVGAVLRRRATPPTLALVAALPAFATVALITQYATLTWFVAGLAVAAQSLQRPAGDPDEKSADEAHPTGSPVLLAGHPSW